MAAFAAMTKGEGLWNKITPIQYFIIPSPSVMAASSQAMRGIDGGYP